MADRTGARQRGARRWAVPAAVLLGLLVVAAALLQGVPSFDPPRFEDAIGIDPVTLPTGGDVDIPGDMGEPAEGNPVVGTVIAVVLALVLAALVAFVIVAVVRRLLRERRAPRRAGGATSADAPIDAPAEDEVVSAPAVRRGVARALLALDEGREPDDAVVAAWIGLEESAADAGVARAASETAAEFTVRVITRIGGVDDEVRVLLRLYEGVRFGAAEASEDDLRDARSALLAVEEAWG